MAGGAPPLSKLATVPGIAVAGLAANAPQNTNPNATDFAFLISAHS